LKNQFASAQALIHWYNGFAWNNGFNFIWPLCRTSLFSTLKQSIVTSHRLYNGVC
jgi:hypothetical protein